MPQLRPVVECCTPRPDVLQGALSDAHFAAQLDRIVFNPGSYPVYGNPDEFFALTYPTSGLRLLLKKVFSRVGARGDSGVENAVVRLETSFGGKTHSLIALTHLAKGARPKNLDQFVDPDLIPDSCQVAAVVGDRMDPVMGAEVAGVRAVTMWGEIAAQLGQFDKLRESDETRTAPGKDIWEKVCDGRPTIIIIDELANHLRQLASSGDEGIRRQAEAMPVFLKNLFEFATSTPNVAVVVTLATRADAFGKQTDEISVLLDEASDRLQEALSDTHSLVGRSTMGAVKPAEDDEIAEILKSRLFERVDAEAAEDAGRSYQEYYETLLQRGEQLTGGAEKPASYGDLVRRSYPFHPELVRVLDKRLGAIPGFQRARGALKLLAGVVAELCSQKSETEIINVADVTLQRSDTLSQLTVGLNRPDFEQVARVDIAASGSHSKQVDSTRFAGRPFSTRAATAVFMHSLELTMVGGATRSDFLLGTMRTGDEPEVIAEALAELERVAWHLFYDGSRWRFLVEPNANRIIEEEKRNVPTSVVNDEVEGRIRSAFPSEGQVRTIHFPATTADVPDEPRLRVIVPHYRDVSTAERSSLPPPAAVVELLHYTGAAHNVRVNRNAVVFVVADEDGIEPMRDRIRMSLAAERLAGNQERLRDFSPEVRKKIREAADAARLEAKVAIARCYKHLYLPAGDRSNDYLGHHTLAVRAQGDPGSLTSVVLDALKQEGKVRTERMAVTYLHQKAWPKDAEEVSTKDVEEAFWRDHSAQMIIDPTLIRDAIHDGVRNGEWIYFDSQTQKAWGSTDPQPPLHISSDTYLYTPRRAEELHLMKKPARWEDVAEALTSKSRIAGTELRADLEQKLGGEPAKKEVAEVLARAAEGGDAARVVIVKGEPEPGVKGLTPAQIKETSLDHLTVLRPEIADELGIERPGARKTRSVEGSGAAGRAFDVVKAKALEVAGAAGLESLTVMANAGPGEGVRDLSLLGKAIAMLPRLEIDAELLLNLDFKGLDGGAEIRVKGPAPDYQRVEDALLGLGKTAANVGGTLSLLIRFDTPCDPNGQQYEDITKVIRNLNPGEVQVRGILAWPEG